MICYSHSSRSPAKAKDDEVMYGSGQASSNPNAGLVSGEGSHFPSAASRTGGNETTAVDDTTSTTAVHSGVPGTAQSTGSGLTSTGSTTAGPHSSDLANKADPRVDSDRDGSNTVGNTTTGGTSGLTGTSGTTGSSSTTAPHDSNLMNTLDPRVDNRTTDNTTSNTTGLAGNTSSTSRDHHYGRDAALATGAGGAGYEAERHHHHGEHHGEHHGDHHGEHHDHHGHHHEGATGTNTGDHHYGRDAGIGAGAGVAGLGYEAERHHERNEATGSSTLGNTSTTGSSTLGNTSNTNTTAPHSSNLLNKLDPRVDSSATTAGNSGTSGVGPAGDHHYGRDAGIGAGVGAGAAGLGYEAERHHERNEATDSSALGNTSSTTGSSTLGNTSSTTGSSTLGNTSNTNTTAPHSSNLLNKLDPRVDSSATSTGTSGTSGIGPAEPRQDFDGTASSTAGPHPYHTRAGAVLDPNGPGLSSGLGGASTSGTGYDTTTGQAGQTGQSHLGRDAALAGGVGAGGVGAYEAGRTSAGTGYGTDSTSTTTGQGPHTSSTLNKADPRVDSTTGASSLSGSNTGVTGTGSTTTGSTTGATGTSSTTSTGQGPHSSSLMNKLDPRVDNTTGDWKSSERSAESGTTGQGHAGRDTALAGGAGVAGYEAEKYHQGTSTAGPHDSNIGNRMDPRVDSDRDGSRTMGATGTTGSIRDESQTVGGTGTTGSTRDGTYDSTGTGSQHHYGRDAALAGGAGTAGYEAEKHLHHDQSTTGTSGTTNTSATGTGYGPHSSALLNKLDPHVDSNTGATIGTRDTADTTTRHGKYDSTHPGTLHNRAEEVALAGTAGTAGHEASKHHEHHHGGATTGVTSGTTTGHSNTDTTTGASTTTGLGSTASGEDTYLTGPVHHSALLNKLDPRVKRVTADTDVGQGVADKGTLGGASPYNAAPVDSRLGGQSGATDASTLTDNRPVATGTDLGRDSNLPAGYEGSVAEGHPTTATGSDGHTRLHKV